MGAAPVSAGRHVTQVEMADPPGYFRLARSGRVHLVKRVTRATWRDGETHLTAEFWCRYTANDRQGELLWQKAFDGALLAKVAVSPGGRS